MTTLILVLIVTASAAAADVGLVVFHGPASPSATAQAAHDRAADRARAGQRAWLDLSPPSPPAPTVSARLRGAIDAYNELRWDAALAALAAAITEIERTGGAGATTAELSDAFLFRGLVHTQRGDATAAWEDLIRAATLAPARTLDPARFPTRAVEAFERARQAVTALPRAALTVDAPGCAAWIDGGAAAASQVPHGEHLVRVACPGRAPWGARVVVAGATAVTPALEPTAPPDDAALAALARDRGAAAVVAVVVAEGTGAAPTATVRVVLASGAVSRRASLALGGDAAAARLAQAIDEALAAPRGASPPPRRTRWYQSRWLWAAAGAAATAAIVLPFTIGDGGDDRAVVRPTGWPR